MIRSPKNRSDPPQLHRCTVFGTVQPLLLCSLAVFASFEDIGVLQPCVVVNTLAWKTRTELAFSRVFVVNPLAWKNRIELAAPIFWFVFHPKIANFVFSSPSLAL